MSDIKSKPQSAEWDANYDRVFANRSPVRGRFVWDAKQNRLIPEGEYIPDAPPPISVPIVTDRHYEGVRATDGTDIGSRPKRQEYMRRNDLHDADDHKGEWAKAAAERAAGTPVADIRDTLGRIAYEQKERNRGRKR